MAGLWPISRTPAAACSAIWRLVLEQLLAVLGVFQGHGGVGGQLDQCVFVVLGESARRAC